MRFRLLTASAVATSAIAIAGCGSDEDEKPSPKDIVEDASPGTVELTGKQGDDVSGGTGVIYDAGKRLVVTNAHVVAGLTALKAKIADNERIPAQVLGTAPCEDLAVVKLSSVPSGVEAIELGESKGVENQDEVIALGYPTSFEDPERQKVVSTNGTVQSPDVAASPDDSLPKLPHTIQHSATANPGNSGGPLLDDEGRLVGINTLKNTGEQGEIENQFYAITVDHLRPLLSKLAAGESPANAGWDVAPFKDVPLSDVFEATGFGTAAQGERADELLAAEGIDGLFVFGATADSPADNAEITFGDLVTSIEGTSVRNVADACEILQSASPGQTLRVEGRYLTSGGGEQSFGDEWTTKLELE